MPRMTKKLYRYYHDILRQQRGWPEYCGFCGDNRRHKKYVWGNLTGRYSDIYDFERMCLSCHNKHDRDRLNTFTIGSTIPIRIKANGDPIFSEPDGEKVKRAIKLLAKQLEEEDL